MTHSTLYWHCATYAPDASGGYRPAIEHKLIAVAGIEVEDDETDENGSGLTANVWGTMSPDPRKMLHRFSKAFATTNQLVSLYGNNFGLPVMWANAFQTQYPFRYGTAPEAVDLAVEIGNLVAPSNGLTFDSILDLMQLPARPDMDIVALWETNNKAKQQRIVKRLIVDCCFIALVDIRLQFAQGTITAQYRDNFTQAVLEAAAEKVANVNKVFSNLLAPVEKATEDPTEKPTAEPDDLEEPVNVAAPDDPEQDPDFDELDADDTTDEDEPQDVVAHMDDFDGLDDEDDDGLDF